MEKLKSLFSHKIDKFNLDILNEEVIKQYNVKNENGSIIFNKTEVKFQLSKDKKIITISFGKITYNIRINPYFLYFEEKTSDNCIGKFYNAERLKRLFKKIENLYDLFLDNNIISNLEEILKNENYNTIIIKAKSKKLNLNEFLLLNKKRNFDPQNKIELFNDKFELSPFPDEELNYFNENINLVLDKRNKLVELINNFMKIDEQIELKIFGCYGIGKTMTYLYLSNIFKDYKILYFNLKKFIPKKEITTKIDEYNLFVKEIMRYFTISVEESKNDSEINENYNLYLNEIQAVSKTNFDFWKELIKFMKSNSLEYDTLLIIDQFKENEENLNGLSNLKDLLFDNGISSIKLLISYSVNDTNKDELIYYLQENSQNSPNEIINPESEQKEPFEKRFEKIDIDSQVFYDDNTDDENFKRIIVLNYKYDINSSNNTNENENNKENSTQNNIINANYINESINNNIFSRKKIIYINSLVSIREIIDEKYEKYLKIFNFNPKYYVKFMNFISKHPKENLDDLYKEFLEITYFGIKHKIDTFFGKKGSSSLSNESITNLLFLKDLIDNKIEFTSPILVSYAKKFPMKYIKIKIKKETEKDDDDDEQNIIDLNQQFNNQKFYFDYCFPFFSFILSKIIYMSENNYVINFQDLSGSAIGSFIEQKFKVNIIYENWFQEKIELRYVLNFSTLKEYNNKSINQIDLTNFKEIEYDENIKKINLSKLVHYIVPGSHINKELDSAILIPEFDGTFCLITLQLTKAKDYKIKDKEEYIQASFIAKTKFENLYNIKINNVHFYFVLIDEFQTEKTINNLITKQISYLLFSLKNKNITKDGEKILSVYNLKSKDSAISQNSDIIDKDLDIKNNSISEIEFFLRKKRGQGPIITRNMYERARLEIFKRDKGLRITNKERNNIINKIKSFYEIKYNFTIKYVFKIRYKELLKLSKYKKLFGLFVYNKIMFIYHDYILMSLDEKNNNIVTIVNNMKEIKDEININENNRNSYFHYSKNRISLNEIKEKEIYVFKIFELF